MLLCGLNLKKKTILWKSMCCGRFCNCLCLTLCVWELAALLITTYNLKKSCSSHIQAFTVFKATQLRLPWTREERLDMDNKCNCKRAVNVHISHWIIYSLVLFQCLHPALTWGNIYSRTCSHRVLRHLSAGMKHYGLRENKQCCTCVVIDISSVPNITQETTVLCYVTRSNAPIRQMAVFE